jgi:hypothetical protein
LIESVFLILDGFEREKRKETVYILSIVILHIVRKEPRDLLLRGDELLLLCFFRWFGYLISILLGDPIIFCGVIDVAFFIDPSINLLRIARKA